ncbi:ATP-dependent RNA helicase DHX8 [Penicillium daleae]|uniref:ATP-dependent RNA helicase DHX8 n=1 Tax=Penicillium daleae TaxID=63821 RepID=A0AAD6FY08_9EURO|nr:ATP-dependent RNA helicase DHX8 [Penicillium daleae]KAJ5432885.1 ATP-dependent RNA helicase DHX8 [Penicillium daleae]
MDDLESLELFSLVSRVTNELQNYLGINDKTLAEFVIDQHLKCNGSFPDFKKILDEMGAEFPQSLMESVDRLVLTMHPKYKGKKQENGDSGGGHDNTMDELDALEKKSRVFKGLAVPDRGRRWEEDDYLDRPADNKTDAQAGAMDDTFAMLEGLAGKAKDDKPRTSRDDRSHRKRSRSPEYDDHDRGHRHRGRYRSRSRSTHRRSKNDDFIDEFGRSIGKYGDRDGERIGQNDRRRRRDRDEDEDFRQPLLSNWTMNQFFTRSTMDK